MFRMCRFLLLLNLGCKYGFCFLNEDEEKITVELMNSLETRHWILAEDLDLSPSDFNKFKILINWNKPVMYRSILQLFLYFGEESSFPNINTLIVLKVPNIGIIIQFFSLLNKLKKDDYLYKFKWLVFVKDELLKFEENELFIPYNCLFIIAQPKDQNGYYLKEIYKVKDKTFVNYYGQWSEDFGLLTTDLAMYIRRRNLNNTELLMEYSDEPEKCTTRRQCSHLEVLQDYAKLMNFRYLWIKIASLKNGETGDLVNLALAHSSEFIREDIDYFSPLFKIKLNWYIRRPRYLEQADFFVQPFSDEIWLSILICLITSTGVSAILHYLDNSKKERPNLIDYLFLAFENLCNQDGHPKKVSNSERVTCFTLQFFALFIVPAYSGTIISYLAGSKPQVPFTTLRGFVKNGKYSIGARTNSFSEGLFQVSYK